MYVGMALCVCVCACACLCTRMCTYVHVRIRNMHVHVCMHAMSCHTMSYHVRSGKVWYGMVCMHACMSVVLYGCMVINVSMH